MFANRRLERKVDALHVKLDLIMAHLGIEAPVAPRPAVRSVPRGEGMAEIDALLAQGKKIHAIKRYRELTGCGLKEAKDAVERRYPY
ncbi:ribosomal protein L7/L12 [Streptomyces gardneri]|uniref:ribosomal protein bL12 n=1 Tax=Nocardia TaxID=1817 RepID=UPI001356970F|nr:MULTISPECIES: 50S ribosomal protein L7/L12 [Nocardia]MBF6164706.1 ribosomal protein L7/L12 [Streptomyces gardneri]MBF6209025.1 ribosomal protein L7/L12 [Streptomyces gardneri]UAK32681.1 ribosomal protein L7/L12 [Nocardia asteroides]